MWQARKPTYASGPSGIAVHFSFCSLLVVQVGNADVHSSGSGRPLRKCRLICISAAELSLERFTFVGLAL